MARTSNSQRFTIRKYGKDRCLLSVAEMPSGDLILNLYLKQLGDGEPVPLSDGVAKDRGNPIKEHRYTVHTSPNSPRSNTIKQHIDFADGTSRVSFQHTTALKQTSSFAPIYARLCSALDDPGYDVKPSRSNPISLGDITNQFVLMFAVFLGLPDSPFSSVASAANIHQINFSRFSITLIWSFLTMPPTNHGRFLSVATNPEYGTSKGYSAEECVGLFDHFRVQFRDTITEILASEPGLASSMPMLRASTYVPNASLDSIEVVEWLWGLRLAEIIP